MVHGAFCGGWCFDDFRKPWEAAGFEVAAPDLPGHAPGEGALAAAGLSIRDYAQAVARWIRLCPEPPVLVGHSLGGLVIQLAAALAPVAGLVLIAPSPAWGQAVTSPIELAGGAALLAMRGPYWLQVIEPDYPVVRAFTFDRLGEDHARALYARMVPESGRALFEVLSWWLDPLLGAAAPPNTAAPALVLGGALDRVHAPATVEATATRLKAPCRIFPGVSHWSIGEAAAEPLARAAVDWALALSAARAA